MKDKLKRGLLLLMFMITLPHTILDIINICNYYEGNYIKVFINFRFNVPFILWFNIICDLIATIILIRKITE